jgi:hypothetical protein
MPAIRTRIAVVMAAIALTLAGAAPLALPAASSAHAPSQTHA